MEAAGPAAGMEAAAAAASEAEAEAEAEAAVAAEALRLLRIEPSAAGGPSAGRADGAEEPCSVRAEGPRSVLEERAAEAAALAAGSRRPAREAAAGAAAPPGTAGASGRNRPGTGARQRKGPGRPRHGAAAGGAGGGAAALRGPRRGRQHDREAPGSESPSRSVPKESGRLASQIRRLYGANRRAARPFWLCLTGFAAGTPIYEQCFRMNDGFAGYLMDTTPQSYLDLFPLDAIVYLTPDSENVLEDIDPDKVYVLGGLVDESIHKLTLRRAWEQSLQTARLPIREYMVKAPNARNYHSETLAINQVFDVLSTYYNTRSWPAALRAGVSSGKGYVLPDTVEQVETAQCTTAAQENALFCGEELQRQEAPA
ncbi:tRNA methyltransferase 10 homolog B isoform X2 [Corvus kubaryi]|uniref:tRNA methyltransferase 10 homolog B isoform X2 n=1 Tax=Corvus kubaryi TaxID=68294 RepID=UPI001C053F78|nr:tRNA methyltransferase 10 homolog B isoform X2 [Corvus kubaryi]